MVIDKTIVATMVSKKRVLVPAASVYVLVMVNFLRGKVQKMSNLKYRLKHAIPAAAEHEAWRNPGKS